MAFPPSKGANLTVIARKICRGQLESAGFLVPQVDAEFYPEKDYHTIYFAELVKTVEKQGRRIKTAICGAWS